MRSCLSSFCMGLLGLTTACRCSSALLLLAMLDLKRSRGVRRDLLSFFSLLMDGDGAEESELCLSLPCSVVGLLKAPDPSATLLLRLLESSSLLLESAGLKGKAGNDVSLASFLLASFSSSLLSSLWG